MSTQFRGVNIKVDDAGVIAAISGLEASGFKKAIRTAVTKTAREARKELRASVAMRTSRRSGNLRSAGATKIKTTSRGSMVQSHVGFSSAGYYGRFLSAGTGERHRKNGASTGVLRARNIVPPPLHHADERIVPRIKDELLKAVLKAGL